MICDHAHTSRLWGEIEQCITFSEPAAPIGKFLGAHYRVHDRDGVRYMSVDMVDFLTSAVSAFKRGNFEIGGWAEIPFEIGGHSIYWRRSRRPGF